MSRSVGCWCGWATRGRRTSISGSNWNWPSNWRPPTRCGLNTSERWRERTRTRVRYLSTTGTAGRRGPATRRRCTCSRHCVHARRCRRNTPNSQPGCRRRSTGVSRGSCAACHCGEVRLVFPASDRPHRATRKQFHVVACAACGLLRLDPPPAASELGGYYPATYWFAPDQSTAGTLEETWRRLVLRDHVRFVVRALAESGARGPVLDVGCGGGLFLRMLRDHGYFGIGLDSSAGAASVAWKQNGVPVLL